MHPRRDATGGAGCRVDHASHNGLFVDGARTGRAALRDGTVIRIGQTVVVYVEAEVPTTGALDVPAGTALLAADGLFVAADGGTLFLDEIGELPLDLQPKLLRALATGEVRAVGATAARKVDVRIVAATLRDLDGRVADDRFRANLLNRLAGWPIRIAPLRARRDDVVVIASGLLARRQAPALSADAAEALALRDWPGNVRELEHVLATACIRAADAPPRSTLGLAHLPAELTSRLGPRVERAAALGALPLAMTAPAQLVLTHDERVAALTRFAGNVARVADHFGKDRQQIYRWARRLGVDLGSYREDD